jgi:hypothetical protein
MLWCQTLFWPQKQNKSWHMSLCDWLTPFGRWCGLQKFDEHVVVLKCVYSIHGAIPHWGRRLSIFCYISYQDTYSWMVCGLSWLPKWILKKHVLNEIGPHAQNMITILGSIVNMITKIYITIWWRWDSCFPLLMNDTFM